jgi:hypothetical protein
VLNTHTADFLSMHTGKAIRDLIAKGESQKANNLFPGLLVYNEGYLSLPPPKRLAAVYITDRMLLKVPAPEVQSSEVLPHAQKRRGGWWRRR